MARLTPWFQGKTKPVRDGVYEIDSAYEDCRFYSFWNGERWGWREPSVAQAFRYKEMAASGPVRLWRGLVRRTRNEAKP